MITVCLSNKITQDKQAYEALLDKLESLNKSHFTGPNDFVLYNVGSPYFEPMRMYFQDNHRNIAPYDESIQLYKPCLDLYNSKSNRRKVLEATLEGYSL